MSKLSEAIAEIAGSGPCIIAGSPADRRLQRAEAIVRAADRVLEAAARVACFHPSSPNHDIERGKLISALDAFDAAPAVYEGRP